MAITGVNPKTVEPQQTATGTAPSNTSVENNQGLFEEPGANPNFGDFDFDEYEEHSLDSTIYRYHMGQYEIAKQKYNDPNMSFTRYMALANVGIDNILQQFENLIETGDFQFGDGVEQNKLNKDRKATNPQNKNEEVYWNSDKTKFYLINWDKGTYKTVDPKDLPWIPEDNVEEPNGTGGGDIPGDEEKTGGKIPSDGDKDGDKDFLEKMKEIDPIGYTSNDGSKFDFVIDRNNDGIFNGPEEFLGAMSNWSEMEALDKDGNGIVEGSELAGLKLLRTGANGVQSFIDAIAMNLKIYLNSYKKTEGKDAESADGQRTVGNFTISANGETNRGYNTFDTMDFLNREYGNIFNKKIS